MDLKNDGNHDIEKDQNNYNPERDEKDVNVPQTTRQRAVHVNDDIPIIDYHLLKENDNSRAKVVKVHQIVEARNILR